MYLYASFSLYWLIILAVPLLIFAVVGTYRKSWSKKAEIRQQLLFAVVTFMLSAMFELVGVAANLWNYTGGNWPVILWVVYFVGGLSGYQLVKLVAEKVK